MEAILKHISSEFLIKYEDLLETIAQHSLLDKTTKKQYRKITKFTFPAILLIANKYKIDVEDTNFKKAKLSDFKSHIRLSKEEYKAQLVKKYTCLTFMQYMDITTALNILKIIVLE